MPTMSETAKEQDDYKLSETGGIKVILLYIPIVVSTAIGFAASAIIGETSVVLAGLGVVAYVLGLRHAVDVDHIAAIDNITRKFMQEGKYPVSVGTWFSLGHSSIVVGLIVALVFFTRTVSGVIPALQNNGAIIGTAVSGTFLWLIGLMNLAIAISIYGIYRDLRTGKKDKMELEELLNKRGFMNRYFHPLFKIVSRPWHMYPIGVLFGLGFDTASEVALIAISVGAGVSGQIPLWMILILPFMFTCGMVLLDTTDGVAMRKAYSWAFLKPVRKIYYNLTLTIISVMVALAIGTVEVIQVISLELKPQGAFWAWILDLNFSEIGFIIVVMFIVTWLSSMAYYRFRGIEKAGENPGE